MVKKFPLASRLKMSPYPFAALERKAAELRRSGKIIYDLSIGDPDLPPPKFIVEAVKRGLDHPSAHRYPSSRGEAAVREAVAEWYEGRFGVKLDPARQVAILIGAKEGLAQLARAFVEPGDGVAFPDPGYPVYRRAGCQLVEGKPIPIPLHFENEFLPSLSELSEAKLIYLNYPHNPTGAEASSQFLSELAAWIAKHPSTIVVYDMAYGEVTFAEPAPSLLTHTSEGVEFHSLSKMANATGYRIGFAVGHPDLIDGLVKAKEEMDSGAPLPYQLALMALLKSYRGAEPPEEMIVSREIYKRRKEALSDALQPLGVTLFRSQATFYIWFKVGDDETPFLERALETGVLLTPGSGFGERGKGWVRASVTAPDDDIEGAIKALRNLS